jgi:apolipoprotein N-acyltransferase
LWGQRVLDAAPRAPGPAVALVQGNIPGEMKWSGQHTREILATYLDLSARGIADSTHPVIVIWPETATGTYLRKQLDQMLDVVALTARTGVPIFSGFPDYDLEPSGRMRYFNSAALFSTDGTSGPRYAKRHLVPFGERMPFQWLIPALGKLELGQAEWTPGAAPVLFAAAPGPFGTLICFESIFPDLARGDVRRGARWLVNVTNDEWFGNSAALYQHAAMAVFRAVENHVPLARCANTGLTAVIDASGRVTSRLPVFAPGVLVARLGVPGRETPFTRFGDWPGVLAALVVAGLALRASLGRRR